MRIYVSRDIKDDCIIHDNCRFRLRRNADETSDGDIRPTCLNGAAVRVYLGRHVPRYHVREFRHQVGPGARSSRIGIKFGAPVSKNISCIPMTMAFEPSRKRSHRMDVPRRS